MRDAIRSNVRFLNIQEIFWNKLSASVFCVPEICAFNTHIFCARTPRLKILQFHCYKSLIWFTLLLCRCYVVRYYWDMFIVFSLAVCFHVYEYCFWCKPINVVYLVYFLSTSWWMFPFVSPHPNWISVSSYVWVRHMNILKVKLNVSYPSEQFFLRFI